VRWIKKKKFPGEILEYHELAKALVALGDYLEEKSFSPTMSIFCKPYAFSFHVPNIQEDYAKEVVFHGVKQWSQERNRVEPKTKCTVFNALAGHTHTTRLQE